MAHQAFIPIGEMQVGEQVVTLHGETKQFTSILARLDPPERVYNLEVNGEHTYFVGQQQLLVHNNGCDDIALGLRTNENTGEEVLSRWKGNARSNTEWIDAGIAENGPFAQRFSQATTRTIQRGGRINFHLDNLDIGRALNASRFGDAFDVGVTNWELQQVLHNRVLYSNTDFYLGNQKLLPDDVLELLLGFKGQ